MPTQEQREAELLEGIRSDVESGRVTQMVLTHPSEWGPDDHRLIKAILCMVAARMLLGKL